MPEINMDQRDPTSNLPNELLSMIFETGMAISREEGQVPDARSDFGGQVLDARSDFGEVLSRVSHRWRSIALDTPSLWTEIHYNDQPLRACIAYLSRSRMAPVDVYISSEQELTASLLHSLGEHIGHCRSLCIAPAAPEFQQQVLECTSRYAAPLLRSFSISNAKYDTATQLSAPLFASGAPRLRIVQLVELDLNEAPQAYCIPAFEAVTHLDLSDVYIYSLASYTSFRAILVVFKSLQHLELGLERSFLPLLYHGQPPIDLPALKLLHMDFDARTIDYDFIRIGIHAPSLISLSLVIRGRGPRVPDQSYLADDHFPSLRHLFLSRHVLPRLDDIAKAYPHIERLTFRMGHGEDIEDVLEAMATVESRAEEDEEERTPDARIRWPQMKSIALEGLRKPIDTSVLRHITLKLQNFASSIHTLLLPKPCFGDGDVESLKDIIKIEAVGDEWPTPFEPHWYD